MRTGFYFLLIFLLCIASGVGQAIYTVDSTGDLGDVDLADLLCADINGNCTLRAAIENANKSSKKDKIHFNISGEGPFEINPNRNLPKITEPVELDATTQTSYMGGKPKIILNGTNIPKLTSGFDKDNSPIGFHLSRNSGESVIKGFVVGGFGYSNRMNSGDNFIFYSGCGIFIESEKNIIQSNFIGLRANGSTAFSNIFGIILRSSNNIVGGDKPEHRNIISANRGGILAYSNTLIKGNYIGTNAGGDSAMGNDFGISVVVFSKNNTIEQNLISGNKKGIILMGDRNYVLNNRIGTNSIGTQMIPNQIGVELYDARENVIGGGNLISGNILGIQIKSLIVTSLDNHIWGNLIGTGPGGQKALPNETGIEITKGIGNRIGGSIPKKRNIISGNTGAGIKFVEANDNVVTGNFIGSDLSGEKALPNSIGIEFVGEPRSGFSLDNMIYDNLISGNKTDGIRLDYAKGNSVVSNYIGTAIDGVTPLPNYGNGIYIAHNTLNNCIGSDELAKWNNIAFNKENGIFINTTDSSEEAPRNNQILQNNFFSNKNLPLIINKN